MGKRRGNSEGTIEERDGSWRCRVQVAGRRHSITGRTKAEVRKKLRELLSNADKGMLPPRERLTVGQFMERWLADVVKPARRPSTHISYEQNYRCYIGPELGRVTLSNLQPGHLRKLYASMTESGLKAHTVRRCHAVLHTALEQALSDGLVHRNVAHGLKGLPSVNAEAHEAVILSPVQVSQLLNAEKDGPYHALLTLAAYTGLRQGELLGLRWEDVDLDAGTLSVRQALSIRKQIGPPKSKAGIRSMTLPKVCVEALRAHKVLQTEVRLISDGWNDTGLVFTTQRRGKGRGPGTLPGSPMTQSVVDRGFKRLLEVAGLPKLRFHELRHTACSLMALQGVSASVAMKRMGHSDIRLTLQLYTHVLEQQDKDAAARLDALLG